MSASKTARVGRSADIVMVSQAAWLRPLATKTTASALSSGPGTTEGSSPSVRAAVMASVGEVRTPPLLRVGADAFDTGEPEMVSSRPARVTAACSPASKTFSPPICWVHDRWWVPSMST